MRDAVKYLDQISVMGEVTAQSVSQFLGVVSDAMIANILHHIRQYQTTMTISDFDILIQEITTLSDQGVDLTIFPIQLMQYADHHFTEDAGFFSQMSGLAGTLLSQSRWYPHPLLLYKTVFYTLAATPDHQTKEIKDPKGHKKAPKEIKQEKGSPTP
jgi:DNA polymerase III gamma/tau subunit